MAPNRPRRSNIWLHFIQSEDNKSAKCKYCLIFLSIKCGSLGNLNRHMKNKHPTISLCVERQTGPNILEPQVLQPDDSQPRSDNVLPRAVASTSTVAASVPSTSLHSTIPITGYMRKPPSARRVELIDTQVVAMVAKGHHALRLVEEPEFRTLIEMVSNCPGYQLPTRKTLTSTLIPKTHAEVMEKVKLKLAEARAVCLTTDGWTSITNESYIAVTAHFIDKSTKMCSALLGCFHYNERHTSENLTAFLKQICIDWQITRKIACVVSDNAANILAAIRLGEWRSISCFAHSLNLVVQHSLMVIQGVVSKIKTIVEYFKKSTVGLTKLHEIQKQMGLPTLKLKQECPTRWNSCYDMLDRILTIKDAVISTLALLRSDLSMQPREWEIISQVIPILKPFYEITTEISAEKNVTLSKVLIFVQLLSLHVSRCTSVPSQFIEISELIEKLKLQLQTRFYDFEKSLLYAESTILDPRFKGKGFRTRDSFLRACETLRRRICDVQLQNEESHTPQVNRIPASMVIEDEQPSTKADSIWDEFDREMTVITRPENPIAAGIREFDKYLNNEDYIDRKEDPLQWWESRKLIYPRVYQYMLTRLCIQATSVASERVFSNAGLVLNQRRTLLKPEKVAQLLFLHNNL